MSEQDTTVQQPADEHADEQNRDEQAAEVETREVETRDVQTPAVETPAVEPDQAETAEAEQDRAETAEAERDRAKTAEAVAPEAENADGDSAELPGPDEEAGPSGRHTATSGGAGADQKHLEQEGEVAADFLERLLDIADLDGDIDVDVEADRASVAIVDSDEGRVPRRLVGPDGKVLEALQELTRLAVQASTGDRSRLMLDVAGHRAQRRAELVERARTAIEQVRASGERAELEPMTAFERKVVHDEVLAAGLVSESEGHEPHRYVVVRDERVEAQA